MNNKNPTLRCTLGNNHWMYELVGDGLVRRWEQVIGSGKSEEHFGFGMLSPHLTVSSGRTRGFWKYFLCGILLIGFAAMMFAPMIGTGKWHIALIAFGVVAALMAMWMLWIGVIAFRIRTWTIVRSNQGQDVAYWSLESCDHDEREAFEAAYRAAFASVSVD